VFDNMLEPGRHGMADGRAGVLARPVEGLAIATVAAGGKRIATVVDTLERRFGVKPSAHPAYGAKDGVGFIGTGPGRWLALASGQEGAGFEAGLRDVLDGLGAVTDQSDALVVLELSGPNIARALAKGVTLDLHPSVFSTGSAAVTVVNHIGVTLWQTDDAPTYRLAVPRSYAGSFMEWLTASAAEFGFEILPAGRG
jgi:heterotetrameric sarcosine oxidase gamma subunit